MSTMKQSNWPKTCVCFELHSKAHKGYKSCFVGHAYQPHLPIAVSTLSTHAQKKLAKYWYVKVANECMLHIQAFKSQIQCSTSARVYVLWRALVWHALMFDRISLENGGQWGYPPPPKGMRLHNSKP